MIVSVWYPHLLLTWTDVLFIFYLPEATDKCKHDVWGQVPEVRQSKRGNLQIHDHLQQKGNMLKGLDTCCSEGRGTCLAQIKSRAYFIWPYQFIQIMFLKKRLNKIRVWTWLMGWIGFLQQSPKDACLIYYWSPSETAPFFFCCTYIKDSKDLKGILNAKCNNSQLLTVLAGDQDHLNADVR